jgi:2-polyprenyl-3-methyl-5-hydroxy-6-metoxy-1,4-benzoquinol methylase
MDAQKRFYDLRWENAEAISAWSAQRATKLLSLLRSLPLERPTILDFGCGTGWFTEQLSRFGVTTGIDFSEKAVAKAKLCYPHITFVVGDVLKVSLPEEHFDVVVSQEVIEHVEDQVRYLEQAARFLKSGGYLILSTPNKFVMERLTVTWELQPIEQWLDMKELKHLLRPQFSVIKTTTVLPMGDRGVLRPVNSRKLNNLLRLLISDKRLETLKQRAGFGLNLVVLARKVGN